MGEANKFPVAPSAFNPQSVNLMGLTPEQILAIQKQSTTDMATMNQMMSSKAEADFLNERTAEAKLNHQRVNVQTPEGVVPMTVDNAIAYKKMIQDGDYQNARILVDKQQNANHAAQIAISRANLEEVKKQNEIENENARKRIEIDNARFGEVMVDPKTNKEVRFSAIDMLGKEPGAKPLTEKQQADRVKSISTEARSLLNSYINKNEGGSALSSRLNVLDPTVVPEFFIPSDNDTMKMVDLSVIGLNKQIIYDLAKKKNLPPNIIYNQIISELAVKPENKVLLDRLNSTSREVNSKNVARFIPNEVTYTGGN